MAIYDKEHIQQGIVEYLDVLWNNQEDRIEDAFELLKSLIDVEIIENSNGTAIKFPFGLQMCFHIRMDGGFSTEAIAALGYTRSSTINWVFPQDFNKVFYANVSGGGVDSSVFVSGRYNSNSVFSYRYGRFGVSDTIDLLHKTMLFAVGFWK